MGKVQQRISDTNKLRKLQFGQATMLGITFKLRHPDGITSEEWGAYKTWSFELPPHMFPRERGFVSGHWKRRWECVEAALRVVGVCK